MKFRAFSFGFIAVLTFGLCLLFPLSQNLPSIAQEPPVTAPLAQPDQDSSLATQNQTARNLYHQGQLTEAIALWEKVAQAYQQQGKSVNQAQILSYLTLAYQQQGQWPAAEQAIADSLQLVEANPTGKAVYAESLNTAGTLQLAKGQANQALKYWQQATQIYQQLNDSDGLLRTQINQGRALRALGLYPRACQQMLQALKLPASTCQNLTFEQLTQALIELPPELTPLQVAGWLTFGDTLRDVGQLGGSQTVLEGILPRLPETQKANAIAFSLGQTLQASKETQLALDWYGKAAQTPVNSTLQVQAQLAQLPLLIEQKNWQNAIALVPAIEQILQSLPLSHPQIYAQVNYAERLTELKRQSPLQTGLPTWEAIATRLAQAQKDAQTIGDQRGEIYALGNLGQVYEQTQQWAIAQKLTEQALQLSQGLNAPELTYLWQWQLGRILAQQNQREAAIAAYAGAVETLKPLSQDLTANTEFRFTFQQDVSSVYREFISLLLSPNAEGEISQSNIRQAREQIESLQIEELNNFFRAVCLTATSADIDRLDPNAAILYPIILANRLAIILSLPNQPLQVYNTPLDPAKLEDAIAQLRYTLVIRSRRDFFPPAQALYNWLLRPVEKSLATQPNVNTLVFVLDGPLRNIPIAALYDGKQFLIEKYRLSITPGLRLVTPSAMTETSTRTLFAGISQSSERLGFTPLSYVKQELKAIQSQVSSSTLLNEAFTPEALDRSLTYQSFPIVHLATHGRFSSQLQDTFIATWNKLLDITELSNLLKATNPTGETGIDLLVLSACETAVGDERAALGLAGMAVRSGARSTIATLWSVNDEATAKLMEQLYSQLTKQNIAKSEALRQAQLALLSDRWYKHPFYWAPYILVGNWM
ncbi:MAG: CHAT domain-containing protein [Snowella sp.]|nr:CHAT domain-containing protein [Snowella sp.]